MSAQSPTVGFIRGVHVYRSSFSPRKSRLWSGAVWSRWVWSTGEPILLPVQALWVSSASRLSKLSSILISWGELYIHDGLD